MRLRNEIELENNSEKTNAKKNCIQLNLSLSTWAPHTHTQQSLGGGRTQPGRTQPPLYLVSLENITKVMSGEFNFLRFPFINAFYCKKKKKCRLFYNWCFQIPICSSKLHKEVLHSTASSCQTQGKLLFYIDAGSIHTHCFWSTCQTSSRVGLASN